MWKLLLVCLMFIAPLAAQAQDDTELFKKCTVTAKWSRRGEDAVVTVTIKNKTKKTLVDPTVRVTFYDKDGEEVTSDAKTYFKSVKRGKSKRMEARIFDYVSEDAVKVECEVESGVFE